MNQYLKKFINSETGASNAKALDQIIKERTVLGGVKDPYGATVTFKNPTEIVVLYTQYAGTYETIFQISGGGVLQALSIKAQNLASANYGVTYVVYVDGNRIDYTASAASGRGRWLISSSNPIKTGFETTATNEINDIPILSTYGNLDLYFNNSFILQAATGLANIKIAPGGLVARYRNRNY